MAFAATLLLLISLSAHARPRPSGGAAAYKISFDMEVGWHLYSPSDLATHRYSFNLEQRFNLTPHWSFSGGLKTAAEAAFVTNGRYSGPAVRDESYEFQLRDLFAQYKDGPWVLRVGNQQVVWGEAFGTFYADIVNPKDLRRFVSADLEATRIPVPMVNARWIGGTGSLQLVYIPYPFFNRIPNQGGDYLTLQNPLPGSTLTINDQRTLPFDLKNGEIGLRATQLVSDVDLSFFFFSHYDRRPNFAANVTSLAPLALSLDSTHNRMRTFGLTATAEIASVLFRLEALTLSGRSFDTLNGSTYSSTAARETLGVLEADYAGVASWRFGLQLALDSISPDLPGILLPANTSVSAQAVRTLPGDQSLTALLTYVLADGSSLLRLTYANPVSNSLELQAGLEIFLGTAASEFGAMHGASRLTLSLRAFLGG